MGREDFRKSLKVGDLPFVKENTELLAPKKGPNALMYSTNQNYKAKIEENMRKEEENKRRAREQRKRKNQRIKRRRRIIKGVALVGTLGTLGAGLYSCSKNTMRENMPKVEKIEETTPTVPYPDYEDIDEER